MVLHGWGKRPAAQPPPIYSEFPLVNDRLLTSKDDVIAFSDNTKNVITPTPRIQHNFTKCYATCQYTTKEALSHSARAGGESFFPSRRFRKRWNPVWISRFWNRTDGEKDPLPSRRRIVQSFPNSASGISGLSINVPWVTLKRFPWASYS